MSNEQVTVTQGPERIWLSPICDQHSPDGRMWADPAPFARCDDCGEPWVEYVRADLAAQSPSSDIEAERDRLRIGDKVEVIGEYAGDWRGQDLWVAGIRVHDSGEGLDITLAEQWPVPNRHWREYRAQTDGFREHELIRVAALKETPNVG